MDQKISGLTQFAVVLVAWASLKITSVYAWVYQINAYGDTDYYFRSVRAAMADGSVANQLREYPTPVTWALSLPYLAGGQTQEGYRFLFMIMVSLVDLAFVALLARRLGTTAAMAWLVLTTVAGQLPLLRFDLVPAELAAAGLLLTLTGRTPAAGPVLAAGTAAKIWPILFAPLLLTEARDRVKALLSFVLSGAVLIAVSAVGGGWARLLSPLSYQAERGLQIESLAATPAMLAWAHDKGYSVTYSTFKAYEVTGPMVTSLLRTASGASLVAFLLVGVLLVGWYLRGCPREPAGYLALAMVGLFIVTSRAFSPQYILWVAAVVVVLFGLALREDTEFRLGPAAIIMAGMTVIAVLTSGIYPIYYAGLTTRNSYTGRALTLLLWRNVLMGVWLAFVLGVAVDGLLRAPAPPTRRPGMARRRKR